MLANEFIGGPASDQYNAGFAFRNFAAEYWRTHRAIPLWNPYIFGGMPFVGGMHGDIFYPTAWLRWFLPTGAAMNLGFALHIVLAGVAMYALLRGLRTSWAGAVVGGLAYELTGIVTSLVNPGHDGKLFVSALAPLLFLALLRAVRHRSWSAYGGVALVVGLSLHGHPQMSYYLLVAAGIWAAWLVVGDPQGPLGIERYRAIALGLTAVALGMAIYAVQAMPFAAYIPFSPRAVGGPSVGWEYATGFAFPPAELWSLFYPELNGIVESYTGGNGLKHHTEFLGAVVILLALAGIGGGATRRGERLLLAGIAVLFLLVAFGGHTPFYRLWYEVMPRMKQVRAAGMAFYLVALPVAVYAGLGAERLLRGDLPRRRIVIGAGLFALVGLLGALGGLGGIAETVAHPQLVQQAFQNDPEIRAGGLRLLLAAVAGGALLLAIGAGRLRGGLAVGVLLLVVLADLWSVDRKFFLFAGTPAALFGDDQITRELRKTPMPYRVWDPKGPEYGGLGVYPGSWLMGADVPQLLGYHGNELRSFDELWGGKNLWSNQVSPTLLRLFAVRFVTLREPQRLPGYHQVLGPVTTTVRSSAVLYEADTIPPYVRLMAAAVKAPEGQVAQVVADPRFPALEVAVFSDSEPVSPTAIGSQVPPPPTARATISSWDAGAIGVDIEGRDERKLYLVVAENWYKDWSVTVDGVPATALRAQSTMLSVEIPPGARKVSFEFKSPEYQRGKQISLLAVLAAMLWLIVPQFRKRNPVHA